MFTMPPPNTKLRRTVRHLDVDAADGVTVANCIEDMYADTLDVVIVRNIFSLDAFEAVGALLDTDAQDPGWARPNIKMPVEDIQVLGTNTPATPTYQDPRGATLDAYLLNAGMHKLARTVFDEGFDATHEIQSVLSRFSGGRPVDVPVAADGRRYVPYTIRRLADGKQIGIHHDYHYRLDLYKELSLEVDTGTLVSYVAMLHAPETGGELFVYGATSDDLDVPKLPNGYSYDLTTIEDRYDIARFVVNAGDLFLLASGRCLHRVGRINGPRARITMGGFLALDKARTRVLFWS
jgi:hypothetical protein